MENRPLGNRSIGDIINRAEELNHPRISPAPTEVSSPTAPPISDLDAPNVTRFPRVDPTVEESKLFNNELPGAGNVMARRFADFNVTPNSRGTKPIRIRNN